MGILNRVMTVLKANLNDLINRAEQPEKMLNQLLLDMQEQLAKAKQEVAAAIADEKRLEQQYRNEVEQAREWERKARLAVEKGDDELAKEALRRQSEHERYSLEYKKQWERQKASTEQLRVALQALNRKIEEARRKKTLLIARQRRAEAQKRIHDTMTGLTDTSAFDTFERMAAKVEQMEAEAAASAELGEELSGEALEKRFQELEAGQDVEQALAELKAKMGKASGAS